MKQEIGRSNRNDCGLYHHKVVGSILIRGYIGLESIEVHGKEACD